MWIEILDSFIDNTKPYESLPARGVWIEIVRDNDNLPVWRMSLPARGVWIEINEISESTANIIVTPREGSVD